jgi:hypothetical protein
MHRDCDRCGVFGWCNEEGICNDCLLEEHEGEQDREEEAKETEEEED